MKRVLLDTNIYGKMVALGEADALMNAIISRKDVVIYGFDIVRNELRRTSKELVIEKESRVWRNLRITLLNLYDGIAKRSVPNSRQILLASLDIVVSEDNETMLNEISMKCYRIVNQIKALETPQFIGYRAFRKWFV